MEGSPSAAENNNEDDKEEKRKDGEREPSALERIIADISKPAPEAEKKPTPEEKPVVLPETELTAERVPQEDARRIVHEMVAVEPLVETSKEEEPEPEPESKPEPEVEPEPESEAAPAEKPKPEPVVMPEVEPVKAVETMEAEPEAEPEPVEHIEPQPAPKPEAVPEPEAAPEPAPKPKLEVSKPELEVPEPEPVEAVAKKPETPPDDDDKKPGFIKSLFRRRGKDKTEKEPPKPEEPPEATPEEPVPVVEKDEPEGPEFRFNEKIEEPEEPAEEPEAKPERIGQMLLNAEDVAVEQPQPAAEAVVSSQAAEEKMKVEASPIEPVSGKRIDTLNRVELMDLAATITIDGSNLRHIYETHLIGERGLRRLVAEHVQGGDLAKALRREVLAHEMDFERDPVMRDLAASSVMPFEGKNTTLDTLLQEANVTMADQSEQTAYSKAATKYKAAGARQRQSRQYRMLDVVLVATISTLTLLVILVLLLR